MQAHYTEHATSLEPIIVNYEPLRSQNPDAKTLAHPDTPPLTEPLRSYSDMSWLTHRDDRPAGLGWIILDANSTVCAIGHDRIKGCSSTNYGEGSAMLCGLAAASEFDVEAVWAVTDNHFLEQTLDPDQSRTPSKECTALFDRLQSYLDSFPESNVHATDRSKNKIADRLAQIHENRDCFDVVFGDVGRTIDPA